VHRSPAQSNLFRQGSDALGFERESEGESGRIGRPIRRREERGDAVAERMERRAHRLGRILCVRTRAEQCETGQRIDRELVLGIRFPETAVVTTEPEQVIASRSRGIAEAFDLDRQTDLERGPDRRERELDERVRAPDEDSDRSPACADLALDELDRVENGVLLERDPRVLDAHDHVSGASAGLRERRVGHEIFQDEPAGRVRLALALDRESPRQPSSARSEPPERSRGERGGGAAVDVLAAACPRSQAASERTRPPRHRPREEFIATSHRPARSRQAVSAGEFSKYRWSTRSAKPVPHLSP
jgi:hypothetical protein